MQIFNNVLNFHIHKGKLFYQNNKFEFFYFDKKTKISTLFGSNNKFSVILTTNEIVFFSEANKCKVFTFQGALLYSFEGFTPRLINEYSNLVICTEGDLENKYISARSLKTLTKLWDTNFHGVLFFLCNYFFIVSKTSTNRNIFICLNIETGNVRWQYTLDESFDLVIDTPREKRTIQAFFTRICGDFGGYIWCTLYHDYLLRFDMETGDIQSWSLMDMIDDDQYRTIESCIYFRDILAQAHLNAEQGKIYGLHQKTFLEIDISTGAPKATVHDISETLTENGIEKAEYTPSLVWKQDKVYFCNNGSSTMDHNIGRLDIKTKKIDLVGKTQEKFIVDGMPGHYLLPYNQVMECSDDKVYILTKHGGDLCIYDIDEQKGTIS